MVERVQITVRGIVQGVGFRPFIYSLAVRRSLKGRVSNTAGGVLIDVEGARDSIERFVEDIGASPPPLSRIESISRSRPPGLAHYADFRIVESDPNGEMLVPVSPDIATCEDCLRELFDPGDRRHRYPFINCTNCGPRFTIVEAVPYDRARTTMRNFEMCDECRAEYENPLDRRFHAEPTACPACGPRLRLTDAGGRVLTDAGSQVVDAVGCAVRLLSGGAILAVKGVGGFHLACDALNSEAVGRLRGRKHREDKPFALMVRTVDAVREYCLVSGEEERLLSSGARPVVLLERRAGPAALAEAVAPRVGTLGFMLPYAPLHHLLLEGSDRPLVFTSGNVSNEPICYEDEEARGRLRDIADYFLLHDRRIHVRADDSVTRVAEGREMALRRSRGYAPAPLKVGFEFGRQVLACGAELKNTFCLARGQHAYVSQHIGDLENLETLRSYEQGIEHLRRLLNLRPEAVAYDLHPEYLSTKYALALDGGFEKVGVQHHHAHVASCMADNLIEGEVIGVAMDGLGFGTDGRMWGGEFFVADFAEAERVAHLDYVPMPGGAKAVREPWRMAAVYLRRALGEDFMGSALPFVKKMDVRAWAALQRMAATRTNSPETSSMGRVFDAVSGLLGLRSVVNYEGQAAVELETIADRAHAERYEFELAGNGGIIRAEPVIRRAAEDVLEGVPPEVVSARFHLAVAHLIASVARRISDEHRLDRVVLSGGVFQNMFLLRHARRLLKSDGLKVYTHSRVPPNDGGISLGQAAVANALILRGKV